MPKGILQIELFVSSPSGLDEDRAAVESAITEANRILAPDGLRISPFYWDKDAVPGQGGSEAQSILNQKIVEDTDILVVLMHNRVGTATKSSTSGTIEEFERANALVISKTRKIEICLYFCTAPISPFSDPDQLRSVQEFRRRVQGLGYLTRDYQASADLTISIIPHLVKKAKAFLQDGADAVRSATASSVVSARPSPEIPEDEGLGQLELEEIVAETLARTTRYMEDIASDTAQFTAVMDSTKDEFDRLNRVKAAGASVDFKGAIDSFAEKLVSHLDELEPKSVKFDESFSEAASAVLGLAQEFTISSVEAANSFGEFRSALLESYTHLEEYHTSIASIPPILISWPGLTQKLKKARSRGARVYQFLERSISRNRDTFRGAIDIVESKMTNWETRKSLN